MWRAKPEFWRGIGSTLACALLSACASGPSVIDRPTAPPVREPVRAPSVAGNEAMFMALSLVGTPYRYGGNTPESGFDCSGLIGYVFQHSLALVLPRTTSALFQAAGERISASELRTGDLVFFGSARQVSHAGIYVGESRFVHAPSSGGTVRLDHLDSDYWKARFLGARRVLR
ncbi:MAG: C40 family peptidase [Lysobacteraceae bacterium]